MVVALHADYLSLAVLLDPLHDHADPADFTLAGHKFYLLVFSEVLLDGLDGLIDVDVEDAFELALLHDGAHFFDIL